MIVNRTILNERDYRRMTSFTNYVIQNEKKSIRLNECAILVYATITMNGINLNFRQTQEQQCDNSWFKIVYEKMNLTEKNSSQL